MSDKWTVADGSRICNVDQDTIRRWIKLGWLEAAKDGRGAWRFTLTALMRAEARARLARQRLGRLQP